MFSYFFLSIDLHNLCLTSSHRQQFGMYLCECVVGMMITMARAHRLVKNAHAKTTSYIPFIRFLNNAQRRTDRDRERKTKQANRVKIYTGKSRQIECVAWLVVCWFAFIFNVIDIFIVHTHHHRHQHYYHYYRHRVSFLSLLRTFYVTSQTSPLFLGSTVYDTD